MIVKLTGRQETILALIAQGETDKDIARILKIGERTARRHIEDLYWAFGATNRPNVIHLAHRAGNLK